MYCHDVATALQLLNFVRVVPTENGLKSVLCINWDKVDAHAEKVAKSKTRIYIDQECLRWTPLLTPTVNPFREEKSDAEKEVSGCISTETADIVVPPPEKIIIETQQGVKLKRNGRKRKMSAARTPRQASKNTRSSTPSVPVTPEVEERVEEELVTSSGRKRTRPSKYNDSTYVDIKPKSHVDKRKRNESLNEKDKDVDMEKKKQKVEENKTNNTTKQDAKTAQPISETPTNCKSKRTPKYSQRWSQRRAKHNQQEVPQTVVEPESKPVPKPEPEPETVKKSADLPKLPEAKPVEDEVKITEVTPITSTPQIKKARAPRTMRRKRGWVKGRRRNVDNKKQLTIPELIKNNGKMESETESIISEKSDDEITVKSKTEVLKPKDEKNKRGKRPSCEEDSSAEADDEMEDEVPTEKPAKTMKYKISEKIDNRVDVQNTAKCEKPPPAEVPKVIEKQPEPLIEKQPTPKPVSEFTTSSESETEIDGQKIKIISPEEVLQISQKPALVQQTTTDNDDMKASVKNNEKNENKDSKAKRPSANEIKGNESKTDDDIVSNNIIKNDEEVIIKQNKDVEKTESTVEKENVADLQSSNNDSNILEQIKISASSNVSKQPPTAETKITIPDDNLVDEKADLLQKKNNEEKHPSLNKLPEPSVDPPNAASPKRPSLDKALNNKSEEKSGSINQVQLKTVDQPSVVQENSNSTTQPVINMKLEDKIKDENKLSASNEKIKEQPPILCEKQMLKSNADVTPEQQTEMVQKKDKIETNSVCRENKDKTGSINRVNNQIADVTECKAEPKNEDIKAAPIHQEQKISNTCVISTSKEKVNEKPKSEAVAEEKPKQIVEEFKHKHSQAVLKVEMPIAPKTECITPPKMETSPSLKIEVSKSEFGINLPAIPVECQPKQKIDEDKPNRSYEEKCKVKSESKSNLYEKQHKVKEFKNDGSKSKDTQLKQNELKLKHEIADKRYDIKPKVTHLENEPLLTRPDFPMTANYPLPQGQYQQWHWDPIWSYRMAPIHIPSIDVLPQKHEKEKSTVKPQRHESKYSQQSKCKDKSDKSSPKKEEKKLKNTDGRNDLCTAKTNDILSNESKQCFNQLHNQLEEKTKTKPDATELNSETKVDGHEMMYQPHTPAPSIKQTPPTPSATDIPSMGVYTPDSTTNSVHSLHYNPDLDVGPLGLESPTSISSDMASQNSVEPTRPSSELPPTGPHTNYDCTVQQNLANMHNQVQNATVPASSPNVSVHMQQTTSSKRQLQQQRNRSNTPSNSNKTVRSTPPNVQHTVQHPQQRQRSTPPVQTPHQHMQASPTQVQHQSINAMQQQHQLQAHLQHQVAALHQSYGHPHQLPTGSMHQHTHHAPHHSVISQGNYIPVPQMAVSSQPFSAQGASTYVTVPTMTTVIQHRQPSHQKLGPSAACAVTTGTNFYLQANPHAHTPGPIPTPSSAAIPVSVQNNPSQNATGGNSSCSLAKLQQLTNDMIPHSSCNTMTPPPNAMNLTPPPASTHHPHATMTPPPHQMIQNQAVRNLTTPPSAISANLQQPVLGYHHKYYQPNVNMNQLGGTVTPPMGQNLGRSGRNSANIAVQHMQSPSSRISPNVPNIVPSQYNLNEYRMAAQQAPSAVTGYIANTAAGFINNAQIPMQMMNMTQPNYQNPTAIQRAQQNTMYTTHGYIYNNLNLPLNGTMRR